MELYVIRHGTTDWNAEARFQGSMDIELNSNGRELAGKLGERMDAIHFDLIFSSPLIRAYETACLIRGHRNIQIIRDKALTELSFGEKEGVPFKEWVNSDEPSKYFFSDPLKYIPPNGGETFESAIERTRKFVQEVLEPIYKKQPEARIMLVAHGALLAAMMCYLDNHGIENFWGKGLKGNCEETVYNFDGNKWTKTDEKNEATLNIYEATAKNDNK